MAFIKSYSKSKSLLTGMIAVSVVMFLSAGCTGKTGSGHPGEQDKVQVPGVGLCVHDAATLHLDGRHLCGFALRCGERGAAQNRRTDNCGIRKVGRYPAIRHGESGRVAGHADGNLYPKIVNDTQIDMIMLRHFLNDFLSFGYAQGIAIIFPCFECFYSHIIFV